MHQEPGGHLVVKQSPEAHLVQPEKAAGGLLHVRNE